MANALTTMAELKAYAQRVLQLADDAPLLTVEAHETLQPLHGALTRVLEYIRATVDEECRARLIGKARGLGKRKHAGTGAYDTPEETWAQIREAALAGESLIGLSRRFGVIYNAIVLRRSRDRRRGIPWPEPKNLRPPNLIKFPGKTARR